MYGNGKSLRQCRDMGVVQILLFLCYAFVIYKLVTCNEGKSIVLDMDACYDQG